MDEEKWRHASAMGQLTVWNNSMPALISDLSTAVAMSLFLQNLGWALINAIEVIFVLAWSGHFTLGLSEKICIETEVFHLAATFCITITYFDSRDSWPEYSRDLVFLTLQQVIDYVGLSMGNSNNYYTLKV